MAGKITDEIEKQVIAGVMRATRGNKSEAAKVLGMYRPLLYAKLKKYGLVAPSSKAATASAA